jgi:hypothetical protein
MHVMLFCSAVYAVRGNLEQLLISLTSAEDDGNGFLSFSPRQEHEQHVACIHVM